MKIHIATFFLLFCSILTFAQTNTESLLLDSAVNFNFTSQFDSVPSYKTVYIFDKINNSKTDEQYVYNSENNCWVGKYKTEYFLNQTNQNDSVIYYTYSTEQKIWEKSSKHEYLYDNINNSLISIMFNWDNVNSIWKPYQKGITVNDEYGHQIFNKFGFWDETINNWFFFEIMEYEFDKNQNCTLSQISFNIEGVFQVVEKHVSTFDEKNNWLTNVFFNSYNSLNELLPINKDENTYDVNNNLIMNIKSSWDTTSNSWINVFKYEYDNYYYKIPLYKIYYEWNNSLKTWAQKTKEEGYSGSTTTIYDYIFNETTQNWDYDIKTDYKFDSDTNIIYQKTWKYDSYYFSPFELYEYTFNSKLKTSEAKYTFNNFGDKIAVTKYEIEYDEFKNFIFYQSYKGSGSSSAWYNVSKEERIYNTENKLIFSAKYNWYSSLNKWIGTEKHQAIYDETNKNILIDLNCIWDNATFDWVFNNKTYFYYQSNILSSINVANLNLKIFPNPVQNQLNIETKGISKVQIFNQIGQEILEKDFENSGEIDFSNFKSGIYLVKFSNTEGVNIQKVIKN